MRFGRRVPTAKSGVFDPIAEQAEYGVALAVQAAYRVDLASG